MGHFTAPFLGVIMKPSDYIVKSYIKDTLKQIQRILSKAGANSFVTNDDIITCNLLTSIKRLNELLYPAFTSEIVKSDYILEWLYQEDFEDFSGAEQCFGYELFYHDTTTDIRDPENLSDTLYVIIIGYNKDLNEVSISVDTM